MLLIKEERNAWPLCFQTVSLREVPDGVCRAVIGAPIYSGAGRAVTVPHMQGTGQAMMAHRKRLFHIKVSACMSCQAPYLSFDDYDCKRAATNDDDDHHHHDDDDQDGHDDNARI